MTAGSALRNYPRWSSRELWAFNRDEFLERPTAPLSVWAAPRIVAMRDERSGGTFFAIGRHVVAGLTNDRSGGRPLPGALSRGELVVAAAAAHSSRKDRSSFEVQLSRALALGTCR